MKTKLTICMIVSLSPLLLTPFFGASAQSDRVAPKPAPAESPKPPEIKPKFVVDPDADKYKLVFPAGYEDNLLYKDLPRDRKEKKEREKQREKDADRRIKAYRASFIDQLNKSGEQGYRLIFANTPLIGILRRDEVQYEYALIETESRFFFTKDGFEEKCAPLAEQGFSVVSHIIINGFCLSSDSDTSDPCTYSDLFIMERVKGIKAPQPFRVIYQSPSWRARTRETGLTAQLNHNLALGLCPTHIFSGFEVLLQSATSGCELSPDTSDIQVIVGNMEKRVNELAQQGYRLALPINGAAVMYRNKGMVAPTSYILLSWWKNKNFEQELAKLQELGATYQMRRRDQAKLIFEIPAVNDGRRHEYRLLEFELQDRENVEQKKLEIELAPSSRERLKTLSRLVKEGFEVRDLFDLSNASASKIGVLLERLH